MEESVKDEKEMKSKKERILLVKPDDKDAVAVMLQEMKLEVDTFQNKTQAKLIEDETRGSSSSTRDSWQEGYWAEEDQQQEAKDDKVS